MNAQHEREKCCNAAVLHNIKHATLKPATVTSPPRLPLSRSMRGASEMLTLARRVEQQPDRDVEKALVHVLLAWLEAGRRERQRLGDPHSIVFESELVSRLSARLRSAPWSKVATMSRRDDRHVDGATSALLLFRLLFGIMHDSEERPSVQVLQTLLRQVRTGRVLLVSGFPAKDITWLKTMTHAARALSWLGTARRVNGIDTARMCFCRSSTVT